MNQQKPSLALPGMDAASVTKGLGLLNQAGKFTPQVVFLDSRAEMGSCFSLSKDPSAQNPTKTMTFNARLYFLAVNAHHREDVPKVIPGLRSAQK